MKAVYYKVINILSNGSLSFSFKSALNSRQLLINEKDNKNFHINKKKVVKEVYHELSSEYKKKYLT